MKTMTCKQLGGACEMSFEANTFEEMASLSQQHGATMFQQQEPMHLAAMDQMRSLMTNPAEMSTWMASKRELFESLPENS